MELAAFVKIFVKYHVKSDIFEKITKGRIGIEHLMVMCPRPGASRSYRFDIRRVRMKPIGNSNSKATAWLKKRVAGLCCCNGLIGMQVLPNVFGQNGIQ